MWEGSPLTHKDIVLVCLENESGRESEYLYIPKILETYRTRMNVLGLSGVNCAQKSDLVLLHAITVYQDFLFAL